MADYIPRYNSHIWNWNGTWLFISVTDLSGKKVNQTQCVIEMWNLNASCPNFVHLLLNYSVKYAQSIIRKYCLITELSIFKYLWKNILVFSTALELHGDGDDGTTEGNRGSTAVMGLILTDTTVIAGMGITFTIVLRKLWQSFMVKLRQRWRIVYTTNVWKCNKNCYIMTA